MVAPNLSCRISFFILCNIGQENPGATCWRKIYLVYTVQAIMCDKTKKLDRLIEIAEVNSSIKLNIITKIVKVNSFIMLKVYFTRVTREKNNPFYVSKALMAL